MEQFTDVSSGNSRAVGRRVVHLTMLGIVALFANGCRANGDPVSVEHNAEADQNTRDSTASASRRRAMSPLPAAIITDITYTGSTSASPASMSNSVAFVSLPPGTFAGASRTALRNLRTGEIVGAKLVNGGLDPVAIGASRGDTIEIEIQHARIDVYYAVVPEKRRPRIVRVSPPRGERDVPLSLRMQVVFSEPMVTGVVTSGGIVLQRDGESVAVTVHAIDANALSFEVAPNALLSPETDYELVIRGHNRDTQGDALEVEERTAFTTGVRDASVLGGRLLFSRWDGQQSAFLIYTMLPNGTELVPLTSGNDPDWSPDGTQVVFWRYGSGIYVMRADGSNIRQVSATGYQPAWSPDGQRIAFGCGGICVMNVDGTGTTMLTQHELPLIPSYGGCIRDSDPAWSPDGTTLAFTRWPEGGPLINPSGVRCVSLSVSLNFPLDFWTTVRLVNANGTQDRALSTLWGNGYAGWAAWSPDGRRIAFYGAGAAANGIVVIDADGANAVTLEWASESLFTQWTLFGGPAWSPNGSHLLYTRGAQLVFREAAANGSEMTTTPPSGDWNVFWSWSRR